MLQFISLPQIYGKFVMAKFFPCNVEEHNLVLRMFLKYTRYGMVFQKVFNLVPLNLWAKEVESVIMTFSLQYI